MEQIQFYIKKSTHKVVPSFYSHLYKNDQSNLFRPATESLERQIVELGLDAAVRVVDAQNIPNKTDAHLIGILSENSLIPDDYLSRVISTSNLHRDMSTLCGPVTPVSEVKPTDWFISRIAKTYRVYEIDGFSSFISCYLNNDHLNYPSVDGCVFSGRHYNEAGGYSPVITPRTLLYKNIAFMRAMDKIGPIVYSDRLRTLYYVNHEEFEVENFAKFYYCMGFYDGLNMTGEQLYKKAVINSNMLELENMLLIESNKEVIPAKKEVYAQMISALRCHYELGLCEALAKKKIL